MPAARPSLPDLLRRGAGPALAARLSGHSREHASRLRGRARRVDRLPPVQAELARHARYHPALWASLVSGGRWVYARHLALLGDLALELLRPGGTRYACVSMPPRHGKTQFLSRYLPAWWLGSHPDHNVLVVTYQEGLAKRVSRRVRDDLATWGPHVFGLGSDARGSVAEWGLIADGERTEGSLAALGREGALTGRGANVLLCDDLVKGFEEVRTQARRDTLWEQFTGEILSRLEPDAAAIVVMTRWHRDDLVGRIEQGLAGEGWRIVNLPALAHGPDALGRQEGEALWPQRWPVEALARIRARNDHQWQALYQGLPMDERGSVFRAEWLRARCELAPDHETVSAPDLGAVPVADLRRWATCDLALSTRERADYSVVAVWGTHGPWDRLLLLDLVRFRAEGPDLVPTLRGIAERWGLASVWIEKTAYHLAILQEARRSGLPVRELEPDRDKLARALPLAAILESGRLLFAAGAPWIPELLHELLDFRGDGHGHDDQVDALAYGALVYGRMRGAVVVAPRAAQEPREGERPWVIGRGW